MEYTIGSTVFDSWTITKEIGEGGFGKVFEVRNSKGAVETASALKVIRIPKSVSDVKYVRSQNGLDNQSVTTYFHGFVDRLVKEIATMSRLKDHPNIVRYEDHQVVPREGEFGWDILIRMELLTPFLDYYMDHGISQEEACRLGKEMCSALIFCHRQGIIHRDVKPSNVFVNSLGMFKLGDFGVSRTMDKSTGTARQGTESYMAPEVYLGRHYGESVDIYSLGMMLYQLMNGGRLPFFPPAGQIVGYEDEDAALNRRMRGEPFPPPVSASPEFAEIILKACAYDPNVRYPDGQAMLEDLNRLAFAPEPLAGLQKKTVSFMDMAGAQAEATLPTPEPPTTEPMLPPEPLKQEQPPETPGPRFQTQSPFDQLGGKPTEWQQSPLSGGQGGPETGTTPIAKASVPAGGPALPGPAPAGPQPAVPGPAGPGPTQSSGGWKTAPQKPTYYSNAEKKTGSLKTVVGIFIAIAAVGFILSVIFGVAYAYWLEQMMY